MTFGLSFAKFLARYPHRTENLACLSQKFRSRKFQFRFVPVPNQFLVCYWLSCLNEAILTAISDKNLSRFLSQPQYTNW